MSLEVQVLVSMSRLVVDRGADRAIRVPTYEDIQKWELATLLILHSELNVRVHKVSKLPRVPHMVVG